MSADNVAPIIIKRVKKGGGDGHHGGAWKVAYADFVTAMMAFFLLMWLLNATTEVQRKGIADYFNPTIPINRISGGGDGAFGGRDILSEETLARVGNGSTSRNPAESNKARGDSGVSQSEDAAAEASETEIMQGLEEMLMGKSGESMVSEQMARHIITKLSDEGLIVELFDLPDEPLFDEHGVVPTPLMSELTEMIASVFDLVTNEIAIAGFTRSQPSVLVENPVWDLSNGRANAVRLMLRDEGLADDRVQRTSGFADRKPAAQNPLAVRNNRIEMILLRDRL